MTKGLNLYFDGLVTTERNNYDWESIGKLMYIDPGFRKDMLSRNPKSAAWMSNASSIEDMEGLMPAAVTIGMSAYLGFRISGASSGSHTVYRVGSPREAKDVLEYGFRQAPLSSQIASYEGKLFWTNLKDARWYQNWAGKDQPIMRINVSRSFLYEHGSDFGVPFFYVSPERLGAFNKIIGSIKKIE